MPKNRLKIIAVGFVIGLIDLIPLIPTGAPMFNLVAILVFWLVAALVMSEMRLFPNHALDGATLAALLMMPLILTVTAVNPKDFLPMLSMALLLGPVCALVLARFGLRRDIVSTQ